MKMWCGVRRVRDGSEDGQLFDGRTAPDGGEPPLSGGQANAGSSVVTRSSARSMPTRYAARVRHMLRELTLRVRDATVLPSEVCATESSPSSSPDPFTSGSDTWGWT